MFSWQFFFAKEIAVKAFLGVAGIGAGSLGKAARLLRSWGAMKKTREDDSKNTTKWNNKEENDRKRLDFQTTWKCTVLSSKSSVERATEVFIFIMFATCRVHRPEHFFPSVVPLAALDCLQSVTTCLWNQSHTHNIMCVFRLCGKAQNVMHSTVFEKGKQGRFHAMVPFASPLAFAGGKWITHLRVAPGAFGHSVDQCCPLWRLHPKRLLSFWVFLRKLLRWCWFHPTQAGSGWFWHGKWNGTWRVMRVLELHMRLLPEEPVWWGHPFHPFLC